MEDKYDLPRGVVRACAGLVESCPNERVAQAIKRAEQVIGTEYADNPIAQRNRQHLIHMVKGNLVNYKLFDRETMNRRYGLQISHNELWREKKKFCYQLSKELGFLKSREASHAK